MWSSNAGGDRLDAFVVKVSAHLLAASALPARAAASGLQPRRALGQARAAHGRDQNLR